MNNVIILINYCTIFEQRGGTQKNLLLAVIFVKKLGIVGMAVKAICF